MGFNADMATSARSIVSKKVLDARRKAQDEGVAINRLEWARKSKLDVKAVERAEKADTGMSLDMLDKFAAALNCEAWQLLHPEGGAGEPSKWARLAAQEIDRLATEEERRRVYAMVVHMVNFGSEDDRPKDEPPPAPRQPAKERRPRRRPIGGGDGR